MIFAYWMLHLSKLIYLLQNKPHLVEPIDFEAFVLKNKTLLQNDPQRELLLYPQDDVSVSYYSCTAYLCACQYAGHIRFICR